MDRKYIRDTYTVRQEEDNVYFEVSKNVYYHKGNWYFSDETEDLIGPYDCLIMACTALEIYMSHL